MSEVTYEWNSRDCDLDEYKNGKYTTCYSGQDIADEMNDYRRALTNSNNRTKDLERQLEEARELLEDCLCEIKANYDYDFEGYEMLKERFKQLKEKGE